MQRRAVFLLLILLAAVGASYVVFWSNPVNNKSWHGITIPSMQGGIRVLMVPTPGQDISDQMMQAARMQIEQRVSSGLGVNEPIIRVATSNGQPSISVELPGLNNGNTQQAINSLLKTGKLEFWDTGTSSLQENTTLNPSDYASTNPGNQPLFTGADLDPTSLQIGQDPQTSHYLIAFSMQEVASGKLSSYTASHIGDYLTITLDRQVLSSLPIQHAMHQYVQITGPSTFEQANQFISVLKYGALPASFMITSEKVAGVTVEPKFIAGIIGLAGIFSLVIVFLLHFGKKIPFAK